MAGTSGAKPTNEPQQVQCIIGYNNTATEKKKGVHEAVDHIKAKKYYGNVDYIKYGNMILCNGITARVLSSVLKVDAEKEFGSKGKSKKEESEEDSEEDSDIDSDDEEAKKKRAEAKEQKKKEKEEKARKKKEKEERKKKKEEETNEYREILITTKIKPLGVNIEDDFWIKLDIGIWQRLIGKVRYIYNIPDYTEPNKRTIQKETDELWEWAKGVVPEKLGKGTFIREINNIDKKQGMDFIFLQTLVSFSGSLLNRKQFMAL